MSLWGHSRSTHHTHLQCVPPCLASCLFKPTDFYIHPGYYLQNLLLCKSRLVSSQVLLDLKRQALLTKWPETEERRAFLNRPISFRAWRPVRTYAPRDHCSKHFNVDGVYIFISQPGFNSLTTRIKFIRSNSIIRTTLRKKS